MWELPSVLRHHLQASKTWKDGSQQLHSFSSPAQAQSFCLAGALQKPSQGTCQPPQSKRTVSDEKDKHGQSEHRQT